MFNEKLFKIFKYIDSIFLKYKGFTSNLMRKFPYIRQLEIRSLRFTGIYIKIRRKFKIYIYIYIYIKLL